MLRRSSFAFLAVALVATACSGGGSNKTSKSNAPTITDVQKATSATGTATTAGTRVQRKQSGAVAGAYGASPSRGRVTYPVFPPSGDTVKATAYFVGDDTYVSRAPVAADVVQSPNLDSIDFYGLRESSAQTWLKVPPTITPLVVTPPLLGPYRLLDMLVKANATLEEVGPETVHNEKLTHARVHADVALAPYRVTTLDIWVDSQDRLRRDRADGVQGLVDYTVGQFGENLDVTPPPAAETTSQLPVAGPPAPQPVGAFAAVASGNKDGLAFTVSRAPSTLGGTCWRIETTPKVDILDTTQRCYPARDPKEDRALAVEFPFQSGATGANDIVVGVVPEQVKDATFAFSDGSTAKPVVLDNGQGVIVWAGKSRPFAGALTMTMADGAVFGCGPGDVTKPEQITGLTERQLLDDRKFFWSCLSAS